MDKQIEEWFSVQLNEAVPLTKSDSPVQDGRRDYFGIPYEAGDLMCWIALDDRGPAKIVSCNLYKSGDHLLNEDRFKHLETTEYSGLRMPRFKEDQNHTEK